jgi:vacuolar-type H+-ATPase subunit H
MDRTIEKIIEIEYKAQNIVNEVLRDSEHLSSNAQIEEEIEKEKNRIFHPVTQKLKKERDDKLKYANMQAKKISHDAEAKIASLNKIADSNKNKWIKSILESILESEES